MAAKKDGSPAELERVQKTATMLRVPFDLGSDEAATGVDAPLA